MLQESRTSTTTPTSVSWDLSLKFKLPVDDEGELELPDFPQEYIEVGQSINDDQLSLLEQTDDIKAIEVARMLLPAGRWMPDFYGDPVFLVLQDFQIEQDNNMDWWVAKANYLYDIEGGAGGQTEEGDDTLPYIKIGFSVGNKTKTITQSKEVKSIAGQQVGPNRPFPDTGTAIGVTADGVEGAEVYDSALTLQVTAFYFPVKVNEFFVTKLASVAAHTNSKSFLGQSPGEVLFIGADGGGTVNEIIPITFTFEIKKNISNRPDGTLEPLTAEGHDIIDYRYEKRNDVNGSKMNLQMPFCRFVHRWYDKSDFKIFGFPQ